MAIEYKTVTYRTVENANDNATYCWVELSAAHVPAVNGLIKRITIQGATTSASGMTTEPMYIGIWERQTDGGLIFLGCSKNTVVQQLNAENIWDFDGAVIRGKSLLLGLLSSPDEHWTNNTELLLRSRVQTNDTDGCVILTDIGRIRVTPDITFTVDVPELVPDVEPEPEPEPDDTERVIDISKYWIPLIRDTAEFQQIAAAVNPELNRLLKCKKEVEKSCFLETDFSLMVWERIYNLTVTDGMTFEERRSQVLNRLNQNVPYTPRVVRRMIAAIVGDGNFDFTIDNDTETLHMSLTAGAMSKTAEINQLLNRVLPMNLVVKYNEFPMDYTELEYLQSSGSQYIDTGIATDGTYTISCRLQVSTTGAVWGRACSLPVAEYTGGQSWARLLLTKGKEGLYFYYKWLGVVFSNAESMPPQWDMTQPHDWLAVEGVKSVTLDGSKATLRAMSLDNVDATNPDQLTHYIFTANGGHSTGTGKASMKLYRFCMQDGNGNIVFDGMPILDENKTPCLYDKVSKRCFYNVGTGSFGYRLIGAETDIMALDLDDPYYTAPSGVWVKLIDENTLDIITALDPTVDESQGYKLFADVGDAYQYFNIKEVNEND